MKLKKFLSFTFMFLFVVTLSVGLIGCKKNDHTHSYDQNITYSLSEDGEKAYFHAKCSCGDTSKKQLSNNEYVVANPENAQTVLNGDINNKVVFFTKGEGDGVYGDLKLEVTRETLSAINEFDASNPRVKGDSVSLEQKDSLSEGGAYHYTRNVENVTFIAVGSPVFEGVFTAQSKIYWLDEWFNEKTAGMTVPAEKRKDPIRGIENRDGGTSVGGSASKATSITSEDVAYVQHINLKNIKFKDMNFEGANGRMLFAYATESEVNNITVDNCTFNNDETHLSYASILFTTKTNAPQTIMKNVKVNNCEITKHYQGVRVANANNVSITNNTFTQTTHNAINLQEDDASVSLSGRVLIEGNAYINISERPIRTLKVKNATIIVKNEIFENAADGDEIIKIGDNSNNSTISLIDCVIRGEGGVITKINNINSLQLNNPTKALVIMNAGNYEWVNT